MTAREELAAVMRRHDDAHDHPADELCDARAMHAALTAVFDVIDQKRGLIERHPDDLDGVGGVAVDAFCDDITATIEHHLTGDRA